MNDNGISQNRLDRPFDLSSDRVDFNPNATCDDLDGLDTNEVTGGALNNAVRSIDVVNNGKTFFVLDGFGQLGKFNAVTPNDVDGIEYERKISFSVAGGDTTGGWAGDQFIQSVAFSRDGTKLYTLTSQSGTHAKARQLTTFSLPGPFDISSHTQIHQVDFFDLGVPDDGDVTEIGRGIEFSSDGSAMFLLVGNTEESDETDMAKNYIYQFSLSKNFDVSTATKVGRFQMGAGTFQNRADDQSGDPKGFGFSSDGMKLFIVEQRRFQGVDQINQFRLECPYGLVQCVSDPTASIGSQVELAKQNITLNISSIFYRFEWIKRNRDEENFTSHNININYPNPLLKSLAMSLEPAAKKKIATLISTPKKDQRKSKWSSWSLGDLSLSHFDKLGFENAKNIRNEGITFGADRKFSDNKFFGWAIRYGNGRSNIVNTKQNIHMDSLTLNLYGIMPKDKENYLNAVLGLSALKIDSLYLGKKSGQRYGKQLFTAIDFRTKNSYGKLNLTPTTKFTFGITQLGEYTDFLSDAIDSPTQNIRYDKDTFTTGQISSGFLFEADQITINDKTLQPMGGMEIYYDLSRDINYDYSLVGSNQVNTDTIEGAYNRANLRTSLGFELIYPNGLTLSPLYEKTFAVKGSTLNDVLLSKGITERFIIKISRSKEMDGNNFALDFDPLNQNYANISFNKNLGNLNLKFLFFIIIFLTLLCLIFFDRDCLTISTSGNSGI